MQQVDLSKTPRTATRIDLSLPTEARMTMHLFGFPHVDQRVQYPIWWDFEEVGWT
jgi:hypothetical protein